MTSGSSGRSRTPVKESSVARKTHLGPKAPVDRPERESGSYDIPSDGKGKSGHEAVHSPQLLSGRNWSSTLRSKYVSTDTNGERTEVGEMVR